MMERSLSCNENGHFELYFESDDLDGIYYKVDRRL